VRVLVTGSTGLVGRACTHHLAAAGHDVVGVSRSLGTDPWLAGEEAQDIGADDAAAAIAARVPRCDAIVHAAASRATADGAVEIARDNCVGTQQLLALATGWSVDAFVYVSGITVIGRPVELPITESHPTAPESAYHASKLFGEHLVSIAAAAGMHACSLRLAAPVGAGMPDTRILSTFVRDALAGRALQVAGRGGRRQNYVDVRDAASAFEAAIIRRASGVVNVAGSRSISNLELAELCVELLESDSAIEMSGEDRAEGFTWDVSIEKAAGTLGWAPSLSLEDSVRAVANGVARR